MKEMDVRQLLECPCNHFLPMAYSALLGREPDAIGAFHYARRLQMRLPRQLILAEMRTSEPGLEYASRAPSQELDRLLKRYRLVRDLPMGRLRWRLLPGRRFKVSEDNAYHWEGWANDYAAQLRGGKNPVKADDIPYRLQLTASIELQLQDLRLNVERLTAVLESSVAVLRMRGEPEQVIQPLSEALNAVRFEVPDSAQVSWEARQHLHGLVPNVQNVRS